MYIDRPHLRGRLAAGIGIAMVALNLGLGHDASPPVLANSLLINSPETTPISTPQTPEGEWPILTIGKQDHKIINSSNYQDIDLGVKTIHILTAPRIGMAIIAMLDPEKGAQSPYENGYTGAIDVQPFPSPFFEPSYSRYPSRAVDLSPDDYEGYLGAAVTYLGLSLKQDMNEVPHIATLLANPDPFEPQVMVFKPGAVLINGEKSPAAVLRTQIILDPAS